MELAHEESYARSNMNSLTIVVPFRGAQNLTAIWASEETTIDFLHDEQRAVRCTASFAAVELKRYLQRSLPRSDVVFSDDQPEHGAFIVLSVRKEGKDHGGFEIIPSGPGVSIIADDRRGVITGAYELLRLQGWRWYAPGSAGEIAPPPSDKLVLPEGPTRYSPSMELGRGLDFEYASMDSVELFLWMARNRMNMAACFPATAAFCRKLGMTLKVGGHIFERILDPDRVMPSGRTLWDEHAEWFGLPRGRQRTKEMAQRTQFCVSQEGLVDFLGDELIGYLAGPWKEADRIALWGFDTWGDVCGCERCSGLGNASDQTLFFLSKMRDAVQRALKNGTIGHDVKLAACAYEGTATISGPSNPVPRNLRDSGDYIVFYPINRCYAHDLGNGACPQNSLYLDALKSWFAQEPSLPLMAGEYYNVSKFEDLPLLFTERISRDFPRYHSVGVRGMTYMHVPLVNWGVRTLTQALYAQLAWDERTDVPAFIDEYFLNWYGPHATRMRAAYGLIEEAWLPIAGWRAWSARSVLSQLLSWDGKKPREPLPVDEHFGTAGNAVTSGMRSLDLMRQAMRLIDEARREDRDAARHCGNPVVATNPAEARLLEQASHYEARLGEDRRLLLYGIDTMEIMTALVEYHCALSRDDFEGASAIWRRVESAADRLDSYYLPIGYAHPEPGLVSLDALTRTQVRPLLRRCRQSRLESAAPTG
jgi:hypothetical protein